MSSNGWTRLGGVTSVIAGIALGWWLLPRPGTGVAPSSFYPKLFVLVPVCLVFGLFFAVAGDRVPYRDVERQTLTQAGWALMGVVAVLTLLTFGWSDGWFASR